jgi:hypothetical protein
MSTMPSLSPQLAQPKRRWFRFSLRAMLILTTVLCIWLGRWIDGARKQERAVRAIEAVDGTIVYDYQFDADGGSWGNDRERLGPKWLRQLIGPHFFETVIDVRLVQRGLTARDKRFADIAPHLADLSRLKHLSLWGLSMDDDDFAMVAEYSRAEEMICGMMSISDRSAAQIATATSLRKIGLSGVVISAQGIAEFKKLPRLESFWLASPAEETNVAGETIRVQKHLLKDDAVAAFLEFPRLKNLCLYSTQFTDEGVAALCQLERLESLEIGSQLITNAAIEHMVRLKKLTWLSIWYSPLIDDRCLDGLTELSRLKGLRLRGAITNAGLPAIAKLQLLETLELSGKAIDDNGLLHLVVMKNLKHLDLRSTSVKDGSPGVVQLRQALPGCSISTMDSETVEEFRFPDGM